jgi:hypothetical protein
MRRAVKILTAGLAATIPLLTAGVATSQSSSVSNDQTQTGAIDSELTLDVQTVTDQTSGAATATGNAYSAAVDANALDVQSTQALQGPVNAHALLNVETNLSQTASLSTIATGNAGESDALGGGALTGTVSQDAGPVLVRADDQVEGAAAQGGDLAQAATATANNQGLGTQGGSIAMTVGQTSTAAIEADGGAILQYSPGTVSLSALAVGNNITSTGTENATQTLDLSQSMTGAHTQATRFLTFGNGQDVQVSTTASADNISISNDGGPLDVTVSQDNEGYVRSQAETSAYEFGQGSASATGVGNSLIAGEDGRSLSLNNTQVNNGAGVEVISTVAGTTGYDLAGSSSAIGNSATGYACTTCGGQISVTNSQLNTAGVGATTTVTVAGSARSVAATANAVGNSASFYVSKPGG